MLRTWLFPLSILLGCASTVAVFAFLIDASGAEHPAGVLGLVFRPNPLAAESTVSNAGEVVAAILGIAITVVAIIVELASNRYTHRITELFVGEPINFGVMGFFVVTAIQCLFVSLTFDLSADGTGFVPYTGLGVAMVMLAICLLLLLPYFAFVFAFLNPVSIVDRIQRHTLEVVARAGRDPSNAVVGRIKDQSIRGIEQLADVALNAMENKDKVVSMASVDAMRSLVVDYQGVRHGLAEGWYRVDGDLAHNPDFVSMAPEVLEGMARRRIWFELKILRQYQMLYNEALNRMRDINYLIAINTRLIAEAAMRAKNDELVELVIKFFNTYLRATVNAKDVRTAYNVLNQYRLLAENAIAAGEDARAVEIARYFKYYGLLAFNAKLAFILETVAYDLCTLGELAFDRKSSAARDVLRIFLEVDKESEGDVQELSLRGVRKAQVKLATYYLVHGDEPLAREVFRDMSSERPERLASIRDELMSVVTSDFWEISDRGMNFDYLSPERKEKMVEFFGWFGDVIPPRVHGSKAPPAIAELAAAGEGGAPTAPPSTERQGG